MEHLSRATPTHEITPDTDKDAKNDDLENRRLNFIKKVNAYGDDYHEIIIDKFVKYWTKIDKKGRMNFETEKAFDVKKRLVRFSHNNEKYNRDFNNILNKEKEKEKTFVFDLLDKQEKTKWKSYKDQLQHPLWQKKRLEIFNRDKFKCIKCGDTETQLQVHHIKYTAKEAHLEPDENLITVCADCHLLIEEFKKSGLTIKKVIKHNSKGGTKYIYFITDERPNIIGINQMDKNGNCLSGSIIHRTIAEFLFSVEESENG